MQLVSNEQLHKVSIGKGYARISNKAIIEELSILLKQTIDGLKVHAQFSDKENMLVVDLSELMNVKGDDDVACLAWSRIACGSFRIAYSKCSGKHLVCSRACAAALVSLLDFSIGIQIAVFVIMSFLSMLIVRSCCGTLFKRECC